MGPGIDSENVQGGLRLAIPWVTALVLIWIGYQPLQAPRAVPEDAPQTEFSAERAIEHAAVIAQEPHPMGSEANVAVREYIVAELQDLALEPALYPVSAPDYFGGGEPINVVNIVARIPGTSNTKAVALMAHYDTVPTTPGANDNSVAVAALLETARAVLAEPPLDNDLLLLFTDGEEPNPRPGSTALVEETSLATEIGLVVNLEASGGSGASILAETSGPEGWIINEYGAADPHPAAFSFVTEIVGLFGDLGTDFDQFRNAGVPGLHFAYLRGSPIYHTMADNLDSVDLATLQHHGSHSLSIAQHFGRLNLVDLPDQAPSVFFSLPLLLVTYPAQWAFPLALLTATVFAWVVLLLRRRRIATLHAITARAGSTALGCLVVAVVGTVGWLIIGSMRTTPSVVESYLYFLVLLVMGVLAALRITARNLRSDTTTFVAGVVFFWVVLALTTGLTMPGSSYLFLWPALAGSSALGLYTAGRTMAPTLRFVAVAAPVVILTTPAVDFFVQFAQPRPGNLDSQLLYTMFVPLFLAGMVTALVWAGWHMGQRQTQIIEPFQNPIPATSPPRRRD